MQASAIYRLADFAGALSLDTMPAQIRRQGALSLLDTIGCMIAGSATADAALLLGAERSDGSSGRSTLIGTSVSAPAREAARCNGYFGDIFELNDLTGGHASIGNVAAALALAEEAGAAGPDLLVALIAGIEVTTRIYNALYPTLKAYDECGMVPVGLPSSVGAATVAARLLGLDAGQTRAALAIAAGLAGWCPAEVIFGGQSTLKPMLFGGWPASVGLLAAQYASAGMTGPAGILDSPIGYFAAVSRAPDLTAIDAPAWALAHPRRKLHACCGYIHSALDAVLRLREREPEALDTARAIEVKMPPYVMPAVAKLQPPESPNEARFHVRYCVALAASGHGVILPAHSENFADYLARPEVLAAYKKIAMEGEPSLTHYHHAVVRLERADGGEIAESNAAPKGSPGNPMSDDEVIEKFLRLASPVLGASAAQAVRLAVEDIEKREDLEPLFVLLKR